jgi:2-keto-4-pentenoate hydratase/2-oxohepta-3-ene-1,7-dioic acid hydratase in catechol pathway
MKLVTIDAAPHRHPGMLVGEDQVLNLVQLGGFFPPARAIPATVKGILGEGEPMLDLLRRIEEQARNLPDALRPLSGTKFLAPVPDPQIVLSTGTAYRAHLAEMKVGAPKEPGGFLKNAAAIIGTGSPIVLPPQAPGMVDYEGEFSCVIGRACHNVTADEAMAFVAGYTIVNDVSARDWVPGFLGAKGSPMEVSRAAGLNILGKQFPTFCPIGPALVTAEEIPDPHDLQLTTRLNGKVMQSAHTGDLIFRLAETIAYFSRWYRFSPGDVITTGSPDGVGYARKPQVFMKHGDVVEVEVSRVGILRNPVMEAPK